MSSKLVYQEGVNLASESECIVSIFKRNFLSVWVIKTRTASIIKAPRFCLVEKGLARDTF
jgi:hypothetical protein